MRQTAKVTIVGGGLAGTEAAWQCARRGVPVELHEMRPRRPTEAHATDRLAELVCSNSFGSTTPYSASHQLKEEAARLGSLVLAVARECSVPAGSSLAVDRERFAATVTRLIESEPLVRVVRDEVTEIPPEGVTVVATGPLTSPSLAERLGRLVGAESLYFYDAISPIVSADSLDTSRMYFASRYGKGSADFLNVPLTETEYDAFVDDLLAAEVVLPHDFEEARYFESCLPIEVIASRGRKTLAFGPMKPVGLDDPRTGRRPYAVIQLRAENRHRTAFNLVGFQTKLKYGEQLRVFRKLPGFAQAEFLRLGSLHRNTYLDSPKVLDATLQLRRAPAVLVGGQLTGTEGYLESVSTGLLAGWNAARLVLGRSPLRLPEATMLGGLLMEITRPDRKHFQPMNANLGVYPPLEVPVRDKAVRNRLFSERAMRDLESWLGGIDERAPERLVPLTMPVGERAASVVPAQ